MTAASEKTPAAGQRPVTAGPQGPASGVDQPHRFRDRLPALGILLILVAGIAVGGLLYYRKESRRVYEEKIHDLTAIAELKCNQVERWRLERLVDVQKIANNPYFQAAVVTWRRVPGDTAGRRLLLARLQAELTGGMVSAALIVDTAGQVLLAVGEESRPDRKTTAGVRLACTNRNAHLTSLFRAASGAVCVDAVAPLPDGSGAATTAIVLRSAAAELLFPMLSRWPLPSGSAETLLVERAGNDALFLNELRFRKGTALSLRIPLSQTDVPAVRAILGQRGIWQGRDYRGAAVLADLRPVPGSPWFLVTKLDRSELLSKIRFQTRVMGAFMVGLLLLVAAGAGLIVRSHQARRYKVLFHDLQQTQRELISSETKFRTLFESVTEGVALHELVTDEHGSPCDYRIIAVNPAFSAHTGLAAAQAEGRLASELYGTSAPPYLAEYAQVALGGAPWRFETYFAPMAKHFSISVVSPRRGQFATVFQDVTERIQTMEKLRLHSEEMERFIYTVSHDLKSPLVTIQSFTSYLQEDIARQDGEAQAKDFAFIRNAAEKMGKLLEELLKLSRVGRKTSPKREVALAEIAAAALELVAGRIRAGAAQVRVTDRPVLLYGEPQRLVQLYQNLVDNAAKFIAAQAQPLIEIGAREGDAGVVLYVRDNGAGIDPRHGHKIFGLFEKLDPQSDGTGMGLALAKRIVEVHGGAIWFESAGPGHGTTFYFTLPGTKIVPADGGTS